MKKGLLALFLLSSFVVKAHNKDAIYVFNAYRNNIILDLTWQMNGKGNQGMFTNSKRFMTKNESSMIKSPDSHYHIFHIDTAPTINSVSKDLEVTGVGALAGIATGAAVGAGVGSGVVATGAAVGVANPVGLAALTGAYAGEFAGMAIADKVHHDKNHHGFRAHKDRYFVVEKKKRDKTGDILLRSITEVEYHKLIEQVKIANLKAAQSNLQAATSKLENRELAASAGAPKTSQNASIGTPTAA